MFAELVLDVKRSKWGGLKVRKPYKNISPNLRTENIGTIQTQYKSRMAKILGKTLEELSKTGEEVYHKSSGFRQYVQNN